LDSEEEFERRIQQRRKEAQKKQMHTNRRLLYMWILFGGVCLILAVGLIVWIVCSNKEKKENEERDAQRRGGKYGKIQNGGGNGTGKLNKIT
jgi:hypothetical protein